MKPSGRAEVAGHRVGTEGTWPNKEGEGGGGLAMAENAGRGGREGMCVEKGWFGEGDVAKNCTHFATSEYDHQPHLDLP